MPKYSSQINKRIHVCTNLFSYDANNYITGHFVHPNMVCIIVRASVYNCFLCQIKQVENLQCNLLYICLVLTSAVSFSVSFRYTCRRLHQVHALA